MSQKQPAGGSGFFGHVTDEDLDRKLNQILALLRIQAHQGIEIMADLTKLQNDMTALQTAVAALLAKAGTDNQAAVDAIDTTVSTLVTQINDFLSPPAPQPAPEPAPAG